MFNSIDIFTRRYLQITTAFMIFVFIEQYFHIPHAVWIVITGSIIYAGFNPGTVLKRAYWRFSGTLTGVCAVAIMWYIIHLDYRTAIIFAALIAFAMVFFLALPYNYYMIIATLSSDIAVEWGNSGHFSLQYYVVDRVVCTLIVFAICLVMEHLWFGRSNFTSLLYRKTKTELYNEMEMCSRNVDHIHLSKANLLRFVISTRRKMEQITILSNDAIYERNDEIRNDLFPGKMVVLFRQVVSLWYVKKHDGNNSRLVAELEQKIHDSFNQLNKQ